MKKIGLLLFLLLWMTGSAHVYSSEKQITALGDSIPYGYQLTPGNKQASPQAFPYLIGEKSGMAVHNLSVPGLTSGELLQELKTNKAVRKTVADSDYVLLYIGGNDLLNFLKQNDPGHGVDLEKAAPVIRNLIYNVYSTILEIDALTDGEIFIYNLYNPYPAASDQLNAPLAYINKQYQSLVQLVRHFASVTLLDAYEVFDGHPEYIIERDVHPNKKGQEKLAELGWNQLKKKL
ncbi:SGNH/GDSL hydrolase family protein [Halobacillus litoralis]|uniref:SGNH/GDSL hydrolase family protein n=1 Tax=Halobacillus litoralis TaxID=45668 RepID=A0A845DSR1_9BACI|nr:GDSL-type esterase/lipase family protein [Halobacillus litoralis]MYL20446.1 SGNH/GDSL hydrolase family protein [Halobacillus litoralis]MYL36756.1 SGNH/GDSL hydrolase family protein [Halobacillus litoralis]